MSFAFIVLMMLLGSPMMIAFVLQPSREDPANFPVSHHRISPQPNICDVLRDFICGIEKVNSYQPHVVFKQTRCQSQSLESIRKVILQALNLQVEPQLPAGGLDTVQQQWRNTFSNGAYNAVSVISSYSVTPDSTGQKCCSLTSEIFMKDLGWDSWVIHPTSLTIIHCALCNPEAKTVQCPSSHTNTQEAESQVCCHPATEEMVPVVYVDESSTLVVSSLQLTRSCVCGLGKLQLHSQE